MGDAPKITERFFVSFTCRLGSKWLVLKISEFHPTPRKDHCEKVYLFPATLRSTHVITSEVNLGLFPVRDILYRRELSFFACNKDAVLLPDMHHEIINGTGACLGKIIMMFFQPVVYLRSRGIGILLKPIAYKIFIFVQYLASRFLNG